MGSMQSASKIIYSEDTFFSNVEFAFKGKGVARLMSREMHTGTIKWPIKQYNQIKGLYKYCTESNEAVTYYCVDDENLWVRFYFNRRLSDPACL